MNIPPEQHPAITNLFTRRFIVSPYDARAASLFAAIWQKNGKKYRNGSENDPAREEVKVDCMIVAVAVANNATVLYSEDAHIPVLAKGFVEVKAIPQIPTQPQLIVP